MPIVWVTKSLALHSLHQNNPSLSFCSTKIRLPFQIIATIQPLLIRTSYSCFVFPSREKHSHLRLRLKALSFSLLKKSTRTVIMITAGWPCAMTPKLALTCMCVYVKQTISPQKWMTNHYIDVPRVMMELRSDEPIEKAKISHFNTVHLT